MKSSTSGSISFVVLLLSPRAASRCCRLSIGSTVHKRRLKGWCRCGARRWSASLTILRAWTRTLKLTRIFTTVHSPVASSPSFRLLSCSFSSYPNSVCSFFFPSFSCQFLNFVFLTQVLLTFVYVSFYVYAYRYVYDVCVCVYACVWTVYKVII